MQSRGEQGRFVRCNTNYSKKGSINREGKIIRKTDVRKVQGYQEKRKDKDYLRESQA